MSSVLSYLSLKICSHFIAVCSQIQPTISFELRWVVIGIAIAVIAACLILAGFILTREKTAANEPRAKKISLREVMPEEVDERIATPEETREPAEILASEETTEETDLLIAPQITTAQRITEPKEVVVSEPRLQIGEPSQKKEPGETLPRPSQKTPFWLAITELKIDPAEASPGETVTISFKATNVNDVPSYYSVTLQINGLIRATKGVSLAGISAVHMAFTAVETLPGDYMVDVNGVAGRFTILGAMQQAFVCTSCGNLNYAGYQFCGGCGIRLTVVEQPQAYKNQQICSCPTCGQTVVNGLDFCVNCGTPLK